MKSTGIVRKVDELGRIVIPKELRDSFGIEIKDPIEIYADMESELIILGKYQPGCIFCNNLVKLTMVKGRRVCETCIEEMSVLTERG